MQSCRCACGTGGMLAQTLRQRSCNRVNVIKLCFLCQCLFAAKLTDWHQQKRYLIAAPTSYRPSQHGHYMSSICQHRKGRQALHHCKGHTLQDSNTSVMLHATARSSTCESGLVTDGGARFSNGRALFSTKRGPAGATHRCRQRMSSSRTCRFSARRRLRTTVELRRCSPALRRPPCRKGSTARSGTCSTRNTVNTVLVNRMLGKTAVLL